MPSWVYGSNDAADDDGDVADIATENDYKKLD